MDGYDAATYGKDGFGPGRGPGGYLPGYGPGGHGPAGSGPGYGVGGYGPAGFRPAPGPARYAVSDPGLGRGGWDVQPRGGWDAQPPIQQHWTAPPSNSSATSFMSAAAQEDYPRDRRDAAGPCPAEKKARGRPNRHEDAAKSMKPGGMERFLEER